MRIVSLILFAVLTSIACAESSETAFDPVPPDASPDVKPDAAICDLSSCPAPPGGAQKCCAGTSTCGYQTGVICYPLKDSGTGGTGGGK